MSIALRVSRCHVAVRPTVGVVLHLVVRVVVATVAAVTHHVGLVWLLLLLSCLLRCSLLSLRLLLT